MIDVYAFATPNSVAVPVALEELGLPNTLHPVNIRAGGQKSAEFRSLNPNGKVPVIADHGAEGRSRTRTESAAILVHLAETAGALRPRSVARRARVFEEFFVHASGLGVALGNAGSFRRLAPEPIPLATARFGDEAVRLLGLLDARLAQSEFAAGDDFTIADIARFGWLWRREFAGVSLDETPHLAHWYGAVEARPAAGSNARPRSRRSEDAGVSPAAGEHSPSRSRRLRRPW
jgi:glutathione S-transferase